MEQWVIIDPATGVELMRGYGPEGSAQEQATGLAGTGRAALAVPLGTWRDGMPTDPAGVRTALRELAAALPEPARQGMLTAIENAPNLTALYKLGVA